MRLPGSRALLQRARREVQAAAQVRGAVGGLRLVHDVAQPRARSKPGGGGRRRRPSHTSTVAGLLGQQILAARRGPRSRACSKSELAVRASASTATRPAPRAVAAGPLADRGGRRVLAQLGPRQRDRDGEEDERAQRVEEQPLELQPRGGALLAAQHEGDRARTGCGRGRRRSKRWTSERDQRRQRAQQQPRAARRSRGPPLAPPEEAQEHRVQRLVGAHQLVVHVRLGAGGSGCGRGRRGTPPGSSRLISRGFTSMRRSSSMREEERRVVEGELELGRVEHVEQRRGRCAAAAARGCGLSASSRSSKQVGEDDDQLQRRGTRSARWSAAANEVRRAARAAATPARRARVWRCPAAARGGTSADAPPG